MNQDIGELQRQISQLIRIGTVVSLTGDTATVEIGGVDSDPVQWCVRRAGYDAEWWAFDEGEQVVILCPYGDMAQAIIVGSMYQDRFAAPSTDPNVHRVTYKDGTVVQHDRGASAYSVTVPAGGSITLSVGSTSLKLEDGKATLTAQQFEHAGNQATFDGAVTVKKLLSWLSGVSGSKGSSGGSNAIDGGLNVVNGDVNVDGIGTKSHHHNEHDGPPTSAAQA